MPSMRTQSFSCILLIFALVPTDRLSAESAYEAYAKIITQKALDTNWDYDQSYLTFLCSSKKRVLSKMPSSNRSMKEAWELGREDKNFTVITSAKQGAMSRGIGMQADVKLRDPKSGEKESHRYWIQTEDDGSLCLSGFNF